MLTNNDVKRLKKAVRESRGVRTLAYSKILKIVMESIDIDIRDFLFFSHDRLDHLGRYVLPDDAGTFQAVAILLTPHLSDIERQNLNERFKVAKLIRDREKRLLKKVHPFIEALGESVEILRKHMGEKANLSEVNHSLEKLKETFIASLSGYSSLQDLCRSFSGPDENQEVMMEHLRPLTRNQPQKRKKTSICCQINMTCETDAPTPNILDLLADDEVLPIGDGKGTCDHYRGDDLPAVEHFSVAENHRFSRDGENFIFVVSPLRWYRLGRAAFEFLQEEEKIGLKDTIHNHIKLIGLENTADLLMAFVSAKIIVPNVKKDNFKAITSPAINALQLHLSHRCNMICSYCYADGGSYGGREMDMDLETAKRAIDFLVARSAESQRLRVSFFGGEPLLKIGLIKKIVPYARKKAEKIGKEVEFSLTTNGVLLNEDVRRYLRKERVGILLSLDGPPEIHDKNRSLKNGKGSYAKIIKNLEAETSFATELKVRATHASHEDDIEEIYQHLNSLPISGGFVYHRANPGDEYFSRAISQHSELLERELAYLRRTSELRLSPFLKAVRQIDNHDFVKYPCGGGRNFLAVAPNGELFFCHRFVSNKEYVMGSIWNEFLKIRQYDPPSIDSRKTCKDCWARYHCGGQCYFECVEACGDIARPDDAYCGYMRSLFECGAVLAAAFYENISHHPRT